jgi:hypothetical protein
MLNFTFHKRGLSQSLIAEDIRVDWMREDFHKKGGVTSRESKNAGQH